MTGCFPAHLTSWLSAGLSQPVNLSWRVGCPLRSLFGITVHWFSWFTLWWVKSPDLGVELFPRILGPRSVISKSWDRLVPLHTPWPDIAAEYPAKPPRGPVDRILGIRHSPRTLYIALDIAPIPGSSIYLSNLKWGQGGWIPGFGERIHCNPHCYIWKFEEEYCVFEMSQMYLMACLKSGKTSKKLFCSV